MFKKILLTLLALCLVIALIGCQSKQTGDSSKKDEVTNDVNDKEENEENEEKPDKKEDADGDEDNDTDGDKEDGKDKESTGAVIVEVKEFDTEASIEETEIYNKNDIIITAKDITYSKTYFDINFEFQNNSDEDYSFISGSVGYSCNSVNGLMTGSGYLNCDVAAGKKAKDHIRYYYDELLIYGIQEVADFEVGFDISDDDYNDIYTGPLEVRTSAYESYDYESDKFLSYFANENSTNLWNHKVDLFEETEIYNRNGIKSTAYCFATNKDQERILLLELINTTGKALKVVTSDLEIDGVILSSSTLSSVTVNPGKRCIVDVELDSAIDDNFYKELGIDSIGKLAVSVSQKNEEGKEVDKKKRIEINLSDSKTSIDLNGNEIYNAHGLKIVFKGLAVDDYDDTNMLLIVENTSDLDLEVDLKEGSVSANGFMIDTEWFYGKTVNSETKVFISIQLADLENADIKTIDEITELEFSLDIDKGYKDFDEAKVVIEF